jgi:hypothetical protein
MKWQVRDVPQFRHFAPEHALAVLRVLKDAIDALDRVTGVRTIAVSTGTEVRERIDGVFVEISHDGDSALARARTAGPPEHLGSLNSVLAASWNATGSALRIWLPLELPRVEPS